MKSKAFTVAGLIRVAPRGPRGIYSASYNQNGHHRRVSLKARDVGVAKKRAEQLAGKLLRGDCVASVKPIRWTAALTTIIDLHRTESKSKKTETKYKGELETLAADAEKNGVNFVGKYTAQDFSRYRAERAKSLAPYTLYNHGIIAKQFFNKLVRLKLIETNPLADFQLREPDRVRHPATTLLQFVQIIQVVDAAYQPLFATMGMAGPRLGEAIDIRVEDVDLKSQTLFIKGTKTKNAPRTVPIHPNLAPLLHKAIDGRKAGPLFLNPHAPANATDKRWNPRRVNTRFKDVAESLRMTVGRSNAGLTTHSLRRFFGTTVAMAGVNNTIRKLWMGHTAKDIDDHYIRPPLDAQIQAMATVPFPELATTENEKSAS